MGSEMCIRDSVRAIDARSGRVIGADHELRDGDVVSIQAKT